MPHQIVAASKAYRNLSYNGFYFLADEVGLGKTFEAGIALKQLLMTGKAKRVLIIVKASSMSDWKEALQLFFEFPTVMSSSKKYDLKKSGFDGVSVWGYSDVIICSHHMFRSSIDDIRKHKWDMLILDEALTALDPSLRAQIVNLLLELQQNTGLAYLLITNHLRLVKHIADDLLVLHQGKALDYGETAYVFEHAEHDYSRKLINSAIA